MGKIGTLLDLTGRRFGRLEVIGFDHRIHKPYGTWIYWKCKCDCGNTKVVRKDHLISGATKSCGCFEKENLNKLAFKSTHEQSHTKLYYVWNSMKQRCNNPKVKGYKYWGGRGISVCDEWKDSFYSFYLWATNNGYNHGLTIDRIDVDGNYEPSNCRWVTMKVQANNKRNRKHEEEVK